MGARVSIKLDHSQIQQSFFKFTKLGLRLRIINRDRDDDKLTGRPICWRCNVFIVGRLQRIKRTDYYGKISANRDGAFYSQLKLFVWPDNKIRLDSCGLFCAH